MSRQKSAARTATGEEALAFLESVVADGPIGYALLDTQLRFLWLNELLARINGRSVREHIGVSAEEILGPEHWPTRKPLLEDALAGRTTADVTLAGLHTQSSGREPRVLVSYTPVRVNEVGVGVGVAVRDVTTLVEAEIHQPADLHAVPPQGPWTKSSPKSPTGSSLSASGRARLPICVRTVWRA